MAETRQKRQRVERARRILFDLEEFVLDVLEQDGPTPPHEIAQKYEIMSPTYDNRYLLIRGIIDRLLRADLIKRLSYGREVKLKEDERGRD